MPEFGNGPQQGLGLLLDINEERLVTGSTYFIVYFVILIIFFCFRSFGSVYASQSDGL